MKQTTWFRYENGSDVQLFQNGNNIKITMETLNTTTRSTLTIRVTGMENYTQVNASFAGNESNGVIDHEDIDVTLECYPPASWI